MTPYSRLTSTKVNAGVTVLVVGLVIQLIALGVFVIHAVLFAIILRIRRHDLDLEFASVYNSNKFTLLLVGMRHFSFSVIKSTDC